MNDLNTVYKAFQRIVNKLPKDSSQRLYYEIIMKYLLLEHKYQDIVERSRKPILHYFKYHLPVIDEDYFHYLYNPYNPVRFAIETFSNIEEIKKELQNNF